MAALQQRSRSVETGCHQAKLVLLRRIHPSLTDPGPEHSLLYSTLTVMNLVSLTSLDSERTQNSEDFSPRRLSLTSQLETHYLSSAHFSDTREQIPPSPEELR
jgi:hypothetical protein